jgi:hypothetical protein
MQGVQLNRVHEEKDLGVFITEDLKSTMQSNKAAKKGNQILGLIKRTMACREKDIIIRLYKSLVRPHLDYCCQAWRPYMKKDIEILEKLQRRATKMVFGLQNYTYEERLGKCGLISLEKRMLRADLLETYKICKGIEGLTEQSFFQRRRVGGKRGHQFRMFKKGFRTNVGKFSFGNRVINDWNHLPADILQTDNQNAFKRGLDCYLGRMGD